MSKTPSPFWVWFGGAASAFLTDFIEAGPVGGAVGGLIGAKDGQFNTHTDPHRLLVEAAHLLAVPVGAGLAGLRTWVKANPIPNIFLPTNNENPPNPNPSPAAAPAGVAHTD